MSMLTNEVYEYAQLMWKSKISKESIESIIEPYDSFLDSLVPNTVPKDFRKYIHKERILYDMYLADKIIVFRYDPTNDSDETDSFYSNSELEEDQEKLEPFVNGVRIMDDYDYREQLMANPYTGGYWEAKYHCVIQKKNIKRLQNLPSREMHTMNIKQMANKIKNA